MISLIPRDIRYVKVEIGRFGSVLLAEGLIGIGPDAGQYTLLGSRKIQDNVALEYIRLVKRLQARRLV